MKSEEKLNHLFETLRNEKPLRVFLILPLGLKPLLRLLFPNQLVKLSFKKNFFIMSSIVTTLIVGGLLFLPGNKESKRTPPQNNTTKEAIEYKSDGNIERNGPEGFSKGTWKLDTTKGELITKTDNNKEKKYQIIHLDKNKLHY
jgi:hypothetical protein